LTTRPDTVEKYIEWAKDPLGVDFADAATKKLYETNLVIALNSTQETDFYKQFSAHIERYDAEYRGLHEAALLMATPDLRLEKKPYSSAVDKSFRKNVLWNRRFPKPPEDGWITPENWYFALGDVLRGTIVCKFIDGPEFLAERLRGFGEELGLECGSYSQDRDEGYYAYHFNTTLHMVLTDEHWADRPHKLTLEVQLTTQLQEVLRELTHPHYQAHRSDPRPDRHRWKWEHGSNRFRAGYLGHALHLLEAIVVEIRDDGLKERRGF
jgi:hypothetical protein